MRRKHCSLPCATHSDLALVVLSTASAPVSGVAGACKIGRRHGGWRTFGKGLVQVVIPTVMVRRFPLQTAGGRFIHERVSTRRRGETRSATQEADEDHRRDPVAKAFEILRDKAFRVVS